MDKYPHGKLNASDEGALAVAMYIENNAVVINFGKSVAWIGLPKAQALAFAQSLVEKAERLR